MKETKGDILRDMRDVPYTWLANKWIDEYMPRLSPYVTTTYLTLCRYANNKTQRAWPGITRIAEMANCSRRAVDLALAELRKCNVLRTEQVRLEGVGTFTRNEYILLKEAIWKPVKAEPNAPSAHGKDADDNRTHPVRTAEKRKVDERTQYALTKSSSVEKEVNPEYSSLDSLCEQKLELELAAIRERERIDWAQVGALLKSNNFEELKKLGKGKNNAE